jgi:predicted nucleotidyltransferase
VTDGLLDALRDALRTGPPVRFAFLFGSTARGTARPGSDVDVAFVPLDPAMTLAEENVVADRLERAVGRPVDLVRLDTASNALKWRVARDGVVLVSDPPSEAIRFRALVAIAHDLDRDVEEDANRRYRAALARGTRAR